MLKLGLLFLLVRFSFLSVLPSKAVFIYIVRSPRFVPSPHFIPSPYFIPSPPSVVLSSQSVFYADRIVYKLRHSTQENDQFCSMLSPSGKTDCFTHCEKSKHRSRGVPPIMASMGKLRPNCKRGTFSRLQVYERV